VSDFGNFEKGKGEKGWVKSTSFPRCAKGRSGGGLKEGFWRTKQSRRGEDRKSLRGLGRAAEATLVSSFEITHRGENGESWGWRVQVLRKQRAWGGKEER